MDLGKLRRKLGVYFLSYYYFSPKKILFSVTATVILTHTHNVSESDSNICIQLCTTEKISKLHHQQQERNVIFFSFSHTGFFGYTGTFLELTILKGKLKTYMPDTHKTHAFLP